ncbi:MAG TPA: ATP-binding protein [Candidatus Sumerlaeota bacterium]|nr:MAG: anti-sigma F factor [candidate division BRC1 bacterium ADurb.Bin183]HOE64410.1 ATP-binding protein [Candidatus Sumerlaeota bacterium]HON49786.1 ATP-binding protein [Candidatus Sumerlaeota bacterium]HPL75114.1 ATP-binding protein [Candidatus Sumerlaeota bacterium]HRR31837.1 ATP-binding protein [Candidatus Sumerlaeia bacterium]
MKHLATLRIKADVKLIPAAKSLARETARLFFPQEQDILNLELITEESCLNVIQHAFEPNENGEYILEIIREPGAFVIAIEDRGIPFDFRRIQEKNEPGIGMAFMKKFTDEIRFFYMGRRGKRIELAKNIAYKDSDSFLTEQERAPADAKPDVSTPVSIRIMQPDEAVELMKCIYRVYGYSYTYEDVYKPEKISELLASGMATACVAVTPEKRIVGHLALIKDAPEDLVPESAEAVVDPLFRGRGIFEKMKDFMRQQSLSLGFKGLYSRAVTVHPASQKGNLKLGAKETGIIIANSPPSSVFKKMSQTDEHHRRSVVLYYMPIKPDEPTAVYPPLHHKSMIAKIYEHNQLPRKIEAFNAAANGVAISERSRMDVRIKDEVGLAFLNVMEFGKDFSDLLLFRLKNLCQRKIEVIILDLPLTHPATAVFAPAAEMLGFFFCGVIPNKNNGDILRLEYLNNAAFDPSTVVLVSDFSKEIFDYILAASGLA